MAMQPLCPAIRPFESADRAACLDVFDSNVPRYFAQTERVDFESFLIRQDADFFVAEVDGQVVGCGGDYVRESVGRLCWGMVMQGMHRSGVGAALLKVRVERLFSTPGINKINIDTSQHSAGFFARFGFQVMQVVPDGFAQGIDQVEMSLPLEGWGSAKPASD